MEKGIPEVVLEDGEGKRWNTKNLAHKTVVVYFYPKDDTPGCTVEAKEFTELLPEFEKMGVLVVGVSPDSCQSHQKFALKHNLKVTLLSDPEKKLIKAFGVWGKKRMYGKEYEGVIRSTFLIENGKIVKEWRAVSPKGHAKEVLEYIKSRRNKGGK